MAACNVTAKMANLTKQMQCLGQLKASQLHQLAVALGSACSGSKGTVADGISQILTSGPADQLQAPHPTSDRDHHLSVVSIDVGIQNLAYAHILAPRPDAQDVDDGQGAAGITKLPVLRAWERRAVFPIEPQAAVSSRTKSAKAGLYIPSRYANAAYDFVSDILTRFDPTHILIEQQRFRSGGSSAVAEWTIRNGLFEGMLHAVLRTLREERKGKISLQAIASISPARTARFWLEGSMAAGGVPGARSITGREGKQAKIDIVGKSFLDSEDRLVETDAGQAKAMETAFVEKWFGSSKIARALKVQNQVTSSKRGCRTREPKQPKLDDLADCLLQAIAWLKWYRMRKLLAHDLNANDPVTAVRQRLGAISHPNQYHERVAGGSSNQVES